MLLNFFMKLFTESVRISCKIRFKWSSVAGPKLTVWSNYFILKWLHQGGFLRNFSIASISARYHNVIIFLLEKDTFYQFLTITFMKCKAHGTIVFSQFPGNFFL